MAVEKCLSIVMLIYVMFGGCGEMAEVVTERIVLASSLTYRAHLVIIQIEIEIMIQYKETQMIHSNIMSARIH